MKGFIGYFILVVFGVPIGCYIFYLILRVGSKAVFRSYREEIKNTTIKGEDLKDEGKIIKR